MIVLYTRTYEIAGIRVFQWVAGGCNNFNFKTFYLYIKIPIKRDIFLRYKLCILYIK